MENPSALQSIALGATARTLAGISMLPMTVIKTRYEVIPGLKKNPTELFEIKGFTAKISFVTVKILFMAQTPFWDVAPVVLASYSSLLQDINANWSENKSGFATRRGLSFTLYVSILNNSMYFFFLYNCTTCDCFVWLHKPKSIEWKPFSSGWMNSFK